MTAAAINGNQNRNTNARTPLFDIQMGGVNSLSLWGISKTNILAILDGADAYTVAT